MKAVLRFVVLSLGGALAGVLLGLALGWLSGRPDTQMQGPIAMGTAGLLAAVAMDLHARTPAEEGRRLSEMGMALLIAAVLGCGLAGTFVDFGGDAHRPFAVCVWVLGGAVAGAFLALAYELKVRSRRA